MGGMQTFGPIRPEKDEPVFHARWEGRIMAIFAALGTWQKWNLDVGRQTREFLPPAEYLSLNYVRRRWIVKVSHVANHD
jgi:nitrile hydratase